MNQTVGFGADDISDISIDSILKETQTLVWNISCNIQIPTVIDVDERPNKI